MLTILLFQIEVFLVIISIFIILYGILHVVSVFRLKSGKIVTSMENLVIFSLAVAYLITILITGFA